MKSAICLYPSVLPHDILGCEQAASCSVLPFLKRKGTTLQNVSTLQNVFGREITQILFAVKVYHSQIPREMFRKKTTFS